MAMPPEFKKFKNEDEFTQRFLIPLLQRLGFVTVVNYHGKSEFGKDLVFAEVDRFGAIRFHGMQAKFEDSISLNESETLVLDCKQAFSSPFTHPQTGQQERISTFYAVNAGSVGTTDHYFNSLRPIFGGNAQLLQGKDLLTLDRWATMNRQNDIGAILAGLRFEILTNLFLLENIERTLNTRRQDPTAPTPLEHFRTNAISNYLARPSMPSFIPYDTAHYYLEYVTELNTLLDRFLHTHSNQQLQNDLTLV